MGMYLDVNVIYGVAWDGGSVPAAAWPEDGKEELIEDGEPVFGGRLAWGSFGMTMGHKVDRYLAVITPWSSSSMATNYARRVPCDKEECREMTPTWDAWIFEYCNSIGLELEYDRAPGWLAIGSFG
jgi:hypothetical protein